MLENTEKYLTKPVLYERSSAPFWDDEHISEQMLEAHLNPDWDAATRNHAFVDKSAVWISEIAPPDKYVRLLDLGCGPGLYAERFARLGYSVTGIDLSRRSIAYAKEQSILNGSGITYVCNDYLSLRYSGEFDVVTLIYCDYSALSQSDRLILMRNIHTALRIGGRLIFDVFTPLMRKPESRSWEYNENGGFYTHKPHLCLNSVYRYEDEMIELRRSVVFTDDDVKCYNIWDHFFTSETLTAELNAAGFDSIELYGDIAGGELTETSEAICAVVTK